MNWIYSHIYVYTFNLQSILNPKLFGKITKIKGKHSIIHYNFFNKDISVFVYTFLRDLIFEDFSKTHN